MYYWFTVSMAYLQCAEWNRRCKWCISNQHAWCVCWGTSAYGAFSLSTCSPQYRMCSSFTWQTAAKMVILTHHFLFLSLFMWLLSVCLLSDVFPSCLSTACNKLWTMYFVIVIDIHVIHWCVTHSSVRCTLHTAELLFIFVYCQEKQCLSNRDSLKK